MRQVRDNKKNSDQQILNLNEVEEQYSCGIKWNWLERQKSEKMFTLEIFDNYTEVMYNHGSEWLKLSGRQDYFGKPKTSNRTVRILKVPSAQIGK